jgi:hypothetical protein
MRDLINIYINFLMKIGRFGLLLVTVSSFFLCSRAQIVCGSVENTNGQLTTTSCLCVSGFRWTGLGCQKNCSVAFVPNSRGIPQGLNKCFCRTGFVWNGLTCSSSLNCTQVDPKAVSQDGPSSCICTTGYYWDGDSCEIVNNRSRGVNCAALNNTNGKKNVTDCFCKA